MNESLLFLIPLLPLLCAVLNMFFGMRLPRLFAETMAVTGVAGAFVLTLLFWGQGGGEGTRAVLFSWLSSGSLEVSFALNFDRLAAPMTLMVTGVATLIHLYAVGYMHGEDDYARFYSLLNLFVFAMLMIVLADNLLVLFLGWEGVGLCSYGLIGFWYRKLENAKAGTKAFLVTRVGDVFLGIALLWLFTLTGTLSISAINAQAATISPGVVIALSLLLLLGACGKSAQLPLMTWLADAMAGPTPVSALIHAATMVTAGVYLLCRFFPLVSLSAVAMTAITAIGALTAIYAATCAMAQREIKRVLAYSTMSQVGYMFMAVGAGTVAGAMFHLLTHAFFKAVLFMAAGCVIHLADDENDIFKMGGLARRGPPELFWVFLAGSRLPGRTPPDRRLLLQGRHPAGALLSSRSGLPGVLADRRGDGPADGILHLPAGLPGLCRGIPRHRTSPCHPVADALAALAPGPARPGRRPAQPSGLRRWRRSPAPLVRHPGRARGRRQSRGGMDAGRPGRSPRRRRLVCRSLALPQLSTAVGQRRQPFPVERVAGGCPGGLSLRAAVCGHGALLFNRMRPHTVRWHHQWSWAARHQLVKPAGAADHRSPDLVPVGLCLGVPGVARLVPAQTG